MLVETIPFATKAEAQAFIDGITYGSSWAYEATIVQDENDPGPSVWIEAPALGGPVEDGPDETLED